MNKNLLHISIKNILSLLFIALPFLLNAQTNLHNYSAFNSSLIGINQIGLIKKPIPDNLWGIDFSMYGTSVHYARRIGKGIYVGSEIGLLPDSYDWVIAGGKKTSQENTIWSTNKNEVEYNDIQQMIFIHLFTRWKPKFQWMEVEGGFRWALNSLSYYHLDGLWYDRFVGAYVKPTFGVRRIKVGFRLEAGIIGVGTGQNRNEFISIISPVVRFNFK